MDGGILFPQGLKLNCGFYRARQIINNNENEKKKQMEGERLPTISLRPQKKLRYNIQNCMHRLCNN